MDATAHTADFLREELHVSDQFDNPEYVSITFYIKDNLNTMNRLRTEGLSQTMARLQSNIQKKESSKTKTKKKVISSSNQTSSDDKEKTATLLDSVSGLAFPFDGLTNDDWSSSMVVCIGRHRFSVVVRPPSLVSLAVFPRKHMMASTPIVPSASCICSDSVEYAWYVETSPQAYRCVSTDMFYFPCADDLGRSFKVFATPIRLEHNVKIKGRAVVLYLNGPMQHANECSMKHIRSAFNESSSASPDELRVVSFNILADAYATSDFAKDVIYKYVHETYLESEYRAVLVLDELIAYNADMLCLQECDRKSYELYFEPYLRHKGYASQFTCKVGSVVEGCAGFIRKSKLIVLACVEILLRDVLTEDPLLAQLFDARQDVREIISGCLGQVAQIWVCQSAGDGSRLVLVSNTHLFYQPSAAYVRLLQTYAITSTIQRIKTSILTEHCIPANLPGTRLFQEAGCAATPVVASNPTVSVVFAGDLNSTPETAVIEFLDKGVIEPSHEVWATLNDFRWGMRMEGHPSDESTGVELQFKSVPVAHCLPRLTHREALTSAAGLPKYSNYTQGFKDLLDYVYVSRGLTVVRVAPFPDESVLSEHTALPSMHFPSDHIAVAVDVRLTPLSLT